MSESNCGRRFERCKNGAVARCFVSIIVVFARRLDIPPCSVSEENAICATCCLPRCSKRLRRYSSVRQCPTELPPTIRQSSRSTASPAQAHASRPEFDMSQSGETPKRCTCVPVVRAVSTHSVQAVTHLGSGHRARGVKCRECRVGACGAMCTFVICRYAGKRRVHYHQIKALIRHVHNDLRRRLFARATSPQAPDRLC